MTSFNKSQIYFEYERQSKNMITNQEIIQHKQLKEFRKNNLANNDFSCMLKRGE